MPLFDFRCSKCEIVFEKLVFGSTVPACPECGSTEVEKQVSLTSPPGKSAGIIAKGRAQAAREGHFSNYAASERPKRK